MFNESFAVSVEEEGVARWLAAQNDPALTAQFETSQRYREGFHALVERTRERAGCALRESRERRRTSVAAKAAAFAAMRADYEALKKEWGGLRPTTAGSRKGPNNASLAAVGLYSRKVPEFQALLAAEGDDLPRFYARVKALRERLAAGLGARRGDRPVGRSTPARAGHYGARRLERRGGSARASSTDAISHCLGWRFIAIISGSLPHPPQTGRPPATGHARTCA